MGLRHLAAGRPQAEADGPHPPFSRPPTPAARCRRPLFPCRTAARFLIDELKARVPLWKKEVYAAGHHWIGERS